MYDIQIVEATKDLKKTKRAIVAIGCSFVQGQGAVNDELYENYKWHYKGPGHPLVPLIDSKTTRSLFKKYKNLKLGFDRKIDFTFMEYENAFVNVLCKKYFKGRYTPINLGIRGCGNRASIKELYFNSIDWDSLDEIIVIYVPSGLERFDFINDNNSEHFRWVCMWPHYENIDKDTARRSLWEGYSRALYSEKFQVLEQIAHVQELLSWVNFKNAKLIVTPGFDRRYNKTYFKKMLEDTINRQNDEIVKETTFFNGKHSDGKFIELFPWNNFFKPQGHETFADLAMAQESNLKDKNDYYFQFMGKGSTDRWITPCAHPSQKAHDLFAQELYTHITSNKIAQ